jgi:exosortase
MSGSLTACNPPDFASGRNGQSARANEVISEISMNAEKSANGSAKIVAESNAPNARRRKAFFRLHFYFCFFVAVSCLAFWLPIRELIAFSFTYDHGSLIPLIAPLSVFLIYIRRQKIFAVQGNPHSRRTVVATSALLALGLSALLLSGYQPLKTEKLSFEIVSLVVLWIAGFIFCYGTESFARARFPLLFLLLLVPIPQFVVEKVTFALQLGSYDVAYGLLRVLGVPVLREGFILHLPVIDLEVAKECSGIRSSIALLVTVLVAGECLIRSSWKKLLLVVSAIPVLIIKNGVRIVTIYLLSAYVNPAFLHGWLHTSGGVVFYLLGLGALIPIAVLLRRGEANPLNLSPHQLAVVTFI